MNTNNIFRKALRKNPNPTAEKNTKKESKKEKKETAKAKKEAQKKEAERKKNEAKMRKKEMEEKKLAEKKQKEMDKKLHAQKKATDKASKKKEKKSNSKQTDAESNEGVMYYKMAKRSKFPIQAPWKSLMKSKPSRNKANQKTPPTSLEPAAKPLMYIRAERPLDDDSDSDSDKDDNGSDDDDDDEEEEDEERTNADFEGVKRIRDAPTKCPEDEIDDDEDD